MVISKFNSYREIIAPESDILIVGRGGKCVNVGADKCESLQMKIDELG
jgi:hypothetical protein